MLNELALENISSGHRFDRALQRGLRVDSYASSSPIEAMGETTSFARNAEIYSERETADRIYKVLSGTVRTCKILIDGRRQVGTFYLPGDTFGLETGDVHLFSAEAVTDANVLVIRRGDVVLLAQWEQDVGRQLWNLLRRELEHAQHHLLLLVKTAPGRVASFLLEMAERIPSGDEVKLPMPRRDVADYLGLTIETVSRTLTQLESQSVIALPTSKRVVLRNRAALKRLVA
jgi:CRP/FNR family transcriptional regulator, nitrogen fixation regulation protein